MAGRIPPQFIDELLNRVDIVDLIDSRVPLKKAGKDYQACCPFHDEKTPSFTVSREKQFYHCFGCGAHGTAIGFLIEYDNIGFVDAVEELASREGVEVPREAGSSQGPDLGPLQETLEQAARYYQEQLRHHPNAQQAIDYLKKRGLSGEIAAAYGIGYAPPGYDNLSRRFGQQTEGRKNLWKSGMLAESEDGRRYDRFRDRIMFPIRNHRGKVIGFGGRLLGEGKPKYLNSPETPLFHKGRELYGLYEARRASRKLERLLVVEGYMDVVALAQFGITNCLATLGTATTGDHLERLFRTVNEVVFCFDGDRAGRDAGWKALETAIPLMQDGREARFLFLPEGDDPDTLIRREGSDRFLYRIETATPLSTLLFDKLTGQVDMDSMGGRAQLAETARTLLNRLPKGVFSRMMFKRLSELVGIEIDRNKSPTAPTRLKQRPRTGNYPGTMPPVRRAVALLISHPQLALTEDLPNGWNDLDIPGIPLLKELLDLLRSKPNLSTAALLERWRDREEGRFMNRLAIMPLSVPENGLEREFRDTLASLAGQPSALEWERLVEKASSEGLNSAEKRRLSELSREKAERDKGKGGVDKP